MTRAVRRTFASWIDDGAAQSAARAKGWTPDGADSLLDVLGVAIDCGDFDRVREFASAAKAKDWARRNKARDMWGQPEVVTYEWPDARQLSWERTCVKRERYIGDGLGWENIEC